LHISEHLTYFSAIRPLSSVAVARLFAQFPQYFNVFTSDNSVFRINPANRPTGRWSLESPKSLSSFILLAPWISEDDLVQSFGLNFLDEPSLEPLFYNLIGLEGSQPLDCVGTVEELKLSLNLIDQQGKFKKSYLMKKARKISSKSQKDYTDDLRAMIEPRAEQAFPEKLSMALLASLSPREWDLSWFRGKDIVFVGKGKGRAFQGIMAFLQKHVQFASFTAVDGANGPEPYAFLNKYNPSTTVFIKNEGVPGNHVPVPYITQLQLFFELVKHTGAVTVGITGTKGKSTTASLTAHILKHAGKKVILAGNIGVSPLLSLDLADAETIFVLELSSYQLSDLTVTPHISAAINLYNDHTDWHGTLKNYWEAKHNIMRNAGPKDIFLYNPDFPALSAWANQATCISRTIDRTEKLDMSKAKLYGEHNKVNALFARQIAREFGIYDTVSQVAIESFEPLEHRMEFVENQRGRIYINDAIGMTPESTLASMRAITKKYGQIGCLFLGGKDRNYDFAELMREVASLNIPNIVLFPNTVQKMKQVMPQQYLPNMFETESMVEAVRFADEHAPKNSVVLLSTAAPSYLLWKDFEDKGSQFKAAVHNLSSKE
jgi:UDP-N-acetylmuramoylalanine--D-glutamate ligase